MKPAHIIIFAKAPQPGYAKTRLIPALGAEGAAALAQKMLLHTLQEALDADVGPVELCATPPIDDVAWRGIHLPPDIQITGQGDGDLGARMARAAQRVIAQGETAILIGTDCVEMSATLLYEASQILRDHDTLIHCTTDGGYALLGLNRFHLSLFENIPWSTDSVAGMTLSRLDQLGWSVHVGRMLHDVDEPQDIALLT